ncbi:polysaccharide biosynthesis/export family protein [Rubrolithibacter danxiaensis]|uniref:polysaccharide biosynthesis/export family protein n=1 Tax=Rubrolithibacter danxiaensis TaxID=3390805 RepID=UPI003BF843A9
MSNKKHLPGLIIILFGFLAFSSCSRRNLVYFNDLPQQSTYTSNILNLTEPKIQSGDILNIRVSSLNAESNAIFNGPTANLNRQESNTVGYLVDKDGYINFPIAGRIKLADLTNEQAREKMTKELLKYVKDPIVNLRLANFKVTVIGEVARPSSFTVSDEKINLLEALGMAGDMTPFGKRENVLLIREKEGRRVMARLNLNNKDIINSPYFYLQQNDVVYVEPVKARADQATNSNRFISVIVGLTSVATLVISRLVIN